MWTFPKIANVCLSFALPPASLFNRRYSINSQWGKLKIKKHYKITTHQGDCCVLLMLCFDEIDFLCLTLDIDMNSLLSITETKIQAMMLKLPADTARWMTQHKQHWNHVLYCIIKMESPGFVLFFPKRKEFCCSSGLGLPASTVWQRNPCWYAGWQSYTTKRQ